MTPPHELKSAWQTTLHSSTIRQEDGRTGTFSDASVSLRALSDALQTLEASPRRILKTSARSRVTRGDLFGQEVVVKRYAPMTGWKRLPNRFRPSRARRTWATSETLKGSGIGCSHCLGFLEEGPHGLAIFADEPGTVPARRWIKAWLHQRPKAFRSQFRDDLAGAFLILYEQGVYHADTKASNMLLQAPDEPSHRRILWIDLECVRFGVSPTRRQVVRNLVQLNGSVGSKLSESDRMGFLNALAGRFPWLMDPRIAEQIRHWTRVRLQRELDGQCGP